MLISRYNLHTQGFIKKTDGLRKTQNEHFIIGCLLSVTKTNYSISFKRQNVKRKQTVYRLRHPMVYV